MSSGPSGFPPASTAEVGGGDSVERFDGGESDVVVIGAGHNALICAGYLAAAGLQVTVLEARDVVGGNTVTEELTLPGFVHDSCSSAHVLIQSNPLLRDDELGLCADFGLRYRYTDPAVVMPASGPGADPGAAAIGDAVVMHRDVEATAAELARWSSADAAAYRAFLAEWNTGLAQAHARWNDGVTPDETGRYESLRVRSAWDVVHERFGHPVVRSFLLWLAFATIQDPTRPGTGVLPQAIAAGRTRFGWATPVGGSGTLPAALLAQLRAHGGRVVTSAAARRVEVSGGRATAVVTESGARFRAGQAVVSGAHLAGLPDLLGADHTPPELRRAADAWQPGLSLFAVHAALRSDVRMHTKDGPVETVAAGIGSAGGLRRQLREFAACRPDPVDPWLLVVASTVTDPDRAPAGAGTLKLLTVAPHTRSDGRSWESTKDGYAARLLDLVRTHAEGLEPADVLSVVAESPVDLAARNRHNIGGSCHGGQFEVAGVVFPGWREYRTGVPGLYLTGATTHPGGSVSGRAGRNTARVLLHDLGIDPTTVMSAP